MVRTERHPEPHPQGGRRVVPNLFAPSLGNALRRGEDVIVRDWFDRVTGRDPMEAQDDNAMLKRFLMRRRLAPARFPDFYDLVVVTGHHGLEVVHDRELMYRR